MVAGIFRRAVERAVAVDSWVALVGRDQVVKVLILVAPIPGGDNDIAFDALRPRRLSERQFALDDAIGPVAEIFERHTAELAGKWIDHRRRGLTGLNAAHPRFFTAFELAQCRWDGPRCELTKLMAPDA